MMDIKEIQREKKYEEKRENLALFLIVNFVCDRKIKVNFYIVIGSENNE